MLLAGASAQGASSDEAYPSRPIKVIVPFGAGGGSDTFVRIIQKAVEDNNLLPQPLVVINVPGAGGTIGSQRATNAEPDGYTILNLHQGILTAKYSGKVDHGPEAFEPIIATGEDAMILAVADNSEFTTLRELLDAAKTTPETLAYGANLGAPSHFSGLLLERSHPGARFRFVQTGGGAKRFAELTGGHIAMTTFSVSEYLRFRSGGIRALVFLGPERHPALPDTPTAREQKFDVTTSNLQFWWAPKGTPSDRVQFLADVFEKAMNTDYVREKLASMHVSPVVYKGDRLLEVIAEREAAIAKVDTRKLENLPDLPVIVMVIVALLLITVVVKETRNRMNSKATPSISAADRPTNARRRLTALAFLTPLAYVLLLSLKILPFAAVTALFIFGLGLCLERLSSAQANGSKVSNSSFHLPLIQLAAVALITGIGSYLIFTRVFTIDLP